MTATRLEAAQALHATTRQEVEAIYTSFPALIVEHLGFIPTRDGNFERGVLIGRATVRPKMKTLWHQNQEIEMPKLINVPAPPTKRGPFMHFGAFDNGQTVMVSVSQVALDMLLKDDSTRHPVFPRFMDVTDGWISSDALRMDAHPKYPAEYLNDYGWMLLDKANNPLCKLIMRRNGQIRMEGSHLLLRFSNGIDFQEIGGPPVVHDHGRDPQAGITTVIDTVHSADSTSFSPGQITGPLITNASDDAKAGG